MSMEELFEKLKEQCLIIGMSHEEFWNATYGEIVDIIKANNKRQKQDLQKQASLDYQLANLIGISASRMLDSKTEMPPLEKAYPSLFEQKEEESKPKQQDYQLMKARLMQYAQSHNAKIKKEEVK